MRSISTGFLLAILRASMICVLSNCLAAAAQQMWVPQKIVFTGEADVKNSDLVAVAGLTAGKQITSAEIDVAMQHLADTGLFSNVRYTVNSEALTFALTPIGADQLLSAKYSNFVWWKDAELTTLVHARVPLFTGKVPVSGTMKEEIEKTLEALVHEKGVKASVTSIASAGEVGPVSGEVFSIAEPAVELGEIHIERVGLSAAAKVAEIRQRYQGQEYNAYSSASAIQSNLQDAYLDLGYLDITSDTPVRSEPKIGKAAITVDLTTTVHEGAVYRVSEMAWPESSIVPKEQCVEASQLKTGDIASRIMLLSSKASVERRFAAMGYVEAKLAVMSKKDEAAHQIAYSFGVVPGDQYTVGSVKTPGLNAEQQAQFDKAWKLAPGQAYNEDYVQSFLKTNGFMQSMGGYGVRLGKAADRKSKTVSITISFVKPGAQG